MLSCTSARARDTYIKDRETTQQLPLASYIIQQYVVDSRVRDGRHPMSFRGCPSPELNNSPLSSQAMWNMRVFR